MSEGFSEEWDRVSREDVLESETILLVSVYFLGNVWHALESTTLLWVRKDFAGAMPALGAPHLSLVHGSLNLSFGV